MTGRLFMLLLCFLFSPASQAVGWSDWWLTPDQQGQKLFNQGDFAAAAETFEDAGRRGAAYYRAGDFENAASVYGRQRTPEAAFNRGGTAVPASWSVRIRTMRRPVERRPS